MTNKNQTTPAVAGKTEVILFGKENLPIHLIGSEPWSVTTDICRATVAF